MAVAQQAGAERLLLDEDSLLSLIAFLRSHNFTIGTDQVINLHDLFLAYATQQKLPDNLLAYRHLIAPIICQNESDQRRFHKIWRSWLIQNGWLSSRKAEASLSAVEETEPVPTNPEPVTIRRRFWIYLVIALALMAGIWFTVTYYQSLQQPPPQPLPPGQDITSNKQNNNTLVDASSGAVSGKPQLDDKIPEPKTLTPDQLFSVQANEILIGNSVEPNETLLGISPDGSRLLTGTPSLIKLRLQQTGEILLTINSPGYKSVKFSNTGKYILVLDKNNLAEIFRIEGAGKLYTSKQPVESVEFSENDEVFVVMIEHGYEFYNLENTAVPIDGESKGAATFLSFSILGDMVIASGTDTSKSKADERNVIAIGQIKDKSVSGISLVSTEKPVKVVKFSPDGTKFISYDGIKLGLWVLGKNSDAARSQILTYKSKQFKKSKSKAEGVLSTIDVKYLQPKTQFNSNFRFLDNENVLFDSAQNCIDKENYTAIQFSPPVLGTVKNTNGQTSGQVSKNCPPDTFYSSATGKCARCPYGYTRNLKPETSPQACSRKTQECDGRGVSLWNLTQNSLLDISNDLDMAAADLNSGLSSRNHISVMSYSGPLPLEQQSIWQKPQSRYFVSAVPAVLLLLWMLWSYQRRQLWIQRQSASATPLIKKLHVNFDEHSLWDNESLKLGLLQLRRYQLQPTNRLNISASVEASVRQGGFFKSIYSERPVQPEYLVLVDQLQARDFQRLLIDTWIRRLRAEGLHVSAWYFYQDLRVCYAEKGHHSATIEELAARYHDYRLLIVSDVAGLFTPWSSEPVSWLTVLKDWRDRAIMTPRSGELWGFHEAILNREQFAIVPVDEAGLETIGQYFAIDPDNRVKGAPVLRPVNLVPMPPSIVRDAERWLGESPQADADVARMLKEVEAYLGEHTWLLLCACAVYPQIDWHMTLYLDQALSVESDNSEPRHQALLRLSRLPWFRQGILPDYLRLRLIRSMSREQEKRVRQIIQSLLKSALTPTEGGFDLEFASEVNKGSRRWLRDFLRTLPQEDVLNDYIFIRMMHGRRLGKLSLALPRILNSLFPRYAARVKRLFASIGIILAFAAFAGVWYYWPDWFGVPYQMQIATTTLQSLHPADESPDTFASPDQRLKRLLHQLDQLALLAKAGREKVNNAYNTKLQNEFLPYVLQYISNKVDNPANTLRQYDALKSYLMLATRQHFDESYLTQWLDAQWENNYSGKKQMLKQLDLHLQALLRLQLKPVALDAKLVDNARSNLGKQPLAEQFYNYLRSDSMYAKPVDLLGQLDKSVQRVFRITSYVRSRLTIPALYTREMYKRLDISAGSKLMSQFISDNLWVMGDMAGKQKLTEAEMNQLQGQFMSIYLKDYAGYWDAVLRNLKIKTFPDMAEAENALSLIADPKLSPFIQVLKLVAANTNLTELPKLSTGNAQQTDAYKSNQAVDKTLWEKFKQGNLKAAEKPPSKTQDKSQGLLSSISRDGQLWALFKRTKDFNKHFEDIRLMLSPGKLNASSMQVLLADVSKTREFINQITASRNPDQKAYDVARNAFLQKTSDPIDVLEADAKNAPTLLQHWTGGLASQVRRVSLNTARDYVNQQWQSVYAQYQRTLANRYPLRKTSQQEATLQDFADFFKPGGKLDKFRSDYIDPFLAPDNRNVMVLKTINHQSIGISRLTLVEFQYAEDIRKTFFDNKGNYADQVYKIKPVALDKQVARFWLEVGQSSTAYSHGPTLTATLSWQPNGRDKKVSVKFQDISSAQEHRDTYEGPWAWQKFLDTVRLSSLRKKGLFQMTIPLTSGNTDSRAAADNKLPTAVYEIEAKSTNSMLVSNSLRRFRCPSRI